MSFQPASPISIITCDKCNGQGCPACWNQGIYALEDNQPIIFNLPDFIDFKSRKRFKTIFIIKRIVLIICALLIFITIWTFLK